MSNASQPNVRPASDLFREGEWAGKRVFIVGGGSSLRSFPFDLLRGEIVLAVNKAYSCGVASHVVTGDRRWLVHQASRLSIKPPIVYARRPIADKPMPQVCSHLRVYVLGTCEGALWGRSLEEGVVPGCSGIRAANFADILGADAIYLLGFDLGPRQQRKRGTSRNPAQEWWHGGYPHRTPLGHYEDFLRHWNEAVDSGLIRSRIVNLSPISRLTSVPFQDYREILTRTQ